MNGVGTIQDISMPKGYEELLSLKGRLIQMSRENKQLVKLGSIYQI